MVDNEEEGQKEKRSFSYGSKKAPQMKIVKVKETLIFMTEEYKKYEAKMQKIIEKLEEDYNSIRAGRANPAVLDKINVDYYGVPTPIQQIGNVSIPEARIILIQPWEANILGDVEKAILKSGLGITPNNDGKCIRLVFPQLTEDRRKELSKTVKKHAEEAKVAIRVVRRDGVEDFKAMKKAGEITEDDLKDSEKDMQRLTDEYIEKVGKVEAAKENEIMEI